MTARLKYEWSRTWPDSHHDFTCWDGTECIGRVQLHTTGPNRVWTWHMSPEDGVSFSPANGSDTDKTEACRQLEEAYEKARG